MAKDRPSQANLQPPDDMDTRVRVAVLEAELAAEKEARAEFRADLIEFRRDIAKEINQLGLALSGLATKEELRQLGIRFDKVQGEVSDLARSARFQREHAALEKKSPESTGGELTFKQFVWDCVIGASKFIASGAIASILLAGVYEKFIKSSGLSGGDTQGNPPTMASPPTPSNHPHQ